MKFLISVLIILGVFWVIKQLDLKYKEAQRNSGDYYQSQNQGTPTVHNPSHLEGMPASLESTLQAAKRQGAEGLAKFLRDYRHAIRDPRLADIELDYAVLLNLKDPTEARRVFQTVRRRIPPSSPVYERIQRLEKTYD